MIANERLSFILQVIRNYSFHVNKQQSHTLIPRREILFSNSMSYARFSRIARREFRIAKEE